MKTAAILPAYNEGSRVADVARTVLKVRSVDEVVVVNDGSTDNTADVVEGIPGVCLVNLPINCGKGAAMVAGASATDAEILIFLDADLIGLNAEHVEALVSPVLDGRADMSVGKLFGGRWLTDLAQQVTPNITGQRAITRAIFERIPNLAYTRYGVEMAITRFCQHYGVRTATVKMQGITHPMKEEKLGFVRGIASRARMYSQIARIILDPRAPQLARPRRIGLLRKIAANSRRRGHSDSATYWIYKQERNLRKRRESTKKP